MPNSREDQEIHLSMAISAGFEYAVAGYKGNIGSQNENFSNLEEIAADPDVLSQKNTSVIRKSQAEKLVGIGNKLETFRSFLIEQRIAVKEINNPAFLAQIAAIVVEASRLLKINFQPHGINGHGNELVLRNMRIDEANRQLSNALSMNSENHDRDKRFEPIANRLLPFINPDTSLMN